MDAKLEDEWMQRNAGWDAWAECWRQDQLDEEIRRVGMDLAMVRWRKRHGVSTEDDAEGGHGHHIAGSWERREAEGEVGA